MQELTEVSEAVRDLAMSRFRLIQPYLEQKRSLQLVDSDAKICFRTAQRWVSQYRKRGLVALVRKSREDRGARRVVSAKIKAAIEGLALERPPLPIRSICRQVRQFAQATGELPPRYGRMLVGGSEKDKVSFKAFLVDDNLRCLRNNTSVTNHFSTVKENLQRGW
jgi:putative transposase